MIDIRPDKKKEKDTSVPQQILENLIGRFFPTNRAVIGSLRIAAPGHYYLTSSIGEGAGCMEIINASLQFRAHAIEFDWRVAAGGGALFLLGLVLLFTAHTPKEQ